jgi:hypothetical protein
MLNKPRNDIQVENKIIQYVVGGEECYSSDNTSPEQYEESAARHKLPLSPPDFSVLATHRKASPRQQSGATYSPATNNESDILGEYKHSLMLLLAVEKGEEAIVKLLLKNVSLDVNSMDKNGWKLLSLAVEKGHNNVVKLLLETGKVDVNLTDKSGWIPLTLAALDGHDKVVKLLFETGKVDVNSTDKDGWTPLFLAAQKGHDKMVELLLDTGKVDVGSKDRYVLTSLW